MIDERFRKSEEAIGGGPDVSAEKKAQISSALSKVKTEIANISETHREDAHSIAQHIADSSHEAMRAKKEPEKLNSTLRKLKESVDKFEASHPELVARVNEFATILSEMGI